MSRAIAFTIFLVIGGAGLLLLPGIDPYLTLMLAIAGAGSATVAGVVAVVALGACAEGFGMQPLGTMIGPFLLLFGLMQWTRDQFFVQGIGMRCIWFGVASLTYYSGMVWWRNGRWAELWTMLPLIVLHAGVGLIAASCLQWWLGRSKQPFRRRRILV